MPLATDWLSPMLASLAEVPLVAHGWVYEPKYDGMRAIVEVEPGRGSKSPARVAIHSRNGRLKTQQFPDLTAALDAVAPRLNVPLVLDGEIVAVDPAGRPLGFQHLQGRIHLTGSAEIERAVHEHPVALVLFDLLREDGEDLRPLSLAARRLRLQARLGRVRPPDDRIRLSEIVADDGRALMTRARQEGWEGLIAKDGASSYQSGRRSPAWRKLKIQHEQEFVVGGWTDPRESRQHFGALLVGYYEAGRLVYAGSVGTGFDEKELARLARLFARDARRTSPFATDVRTAEPAHWVEPALVAMVRFTEWTGDGLLRHPVYLGLRDDKNPRDVRRERTTSARLPETPRAEPTSRTTGSRTTRKRANPSTRPRSASRTQQPGAGAVSTDDLAGLADTLQSLERARKDGDLTLPGGDVLHVTNLSKVFWPEGRITKGELLRYYVSVAPWILPAVDDRPLVMKRFPNGIGQQAFYQQRHPEATPVGVRREVLPPGVDPIDEEGPRDRLIGGSLTTLLYMAQLAAISQDPWFSRTADPLHADSAAIDLDPGDGVTFARVLDVARWVKDEMDALGIPGVPKTSGSRGLHIYIPLPPGTSYDSGQLLCQIVATLVATRHPREATVERMVRKRPRGTVYIDYLQNILGKTLATAHSARASDYAGVSTPLTWREVARGVDARAFTVRTAPDRFREAGDLWAALRTGPPVDLNAVLNSAAGSRRSPAPATPSARSSKSPGRSRNRT